MERSKFEEFCLNIRSCATLEEAKHLAKVHLNQIRSPKPVGAVQPMRREPSPASSYAASLTDGPAGTITGSEDSDRSDDYMIDVDFGDTPPPARRRRVD